MKKIVGLSIIIIAGILVYYAVSANNLIDDITGFRNNFSITNESGSSTREFIIAGNWIYNYSATIRNDSDTRHTIRVTVRVYSGSQFLGQNSRTQTLNSGQISIISIQINTGNNQATRHEMRLERG